MPFYFTTFLLGWLEDRCVVGVIVSDTLFIMATNRVYSRHSIPPASPMDIKNLMETDVMERIHLPCHLPLEQVLTMLELRQILRHSCIYRKQMDGIIKSFGCNGKTWSTLISWIYIRILMSSLYRDEWRVRLPITSSHQPNIRPSAWTKDTNRASDK